MIYLNVHAFIVSWDVCSWNKLESYKEKLLIRSVSVSVSVYTCIYVSGDK